MRNLISQTIQTIRMTTTQIVADVCETEKTREIQMVVDVVDVMEVRPQTVRVTERKRRAGRTAMAESRSRAKEVAEASRQSVEAGKGIQVVRSGRR